jgi:hypothetical protein
MPLIPLALKGVAYRPVGAAALLRRNLLTYGLGGTPGKHYPDRRRAFARGVLRPALAKILDGEIVRRSTDIAVHVVMDGEAKPAVEPRPGKRFVAEYWAGMAAAALSVAAGVGLGYLVDLWRRLPNLSMIFLVPVTGRDALRMIPASAPDVVVLDLGLPDRDGKNVRHEARTFSLIFFIPLAAEPPEGRRARRASKFATCSVWQCEKAAQGPARNRSGY